MGPAVIIRDMKSAQYVVEVRIGEAEADEQKCFGDQISAESRYKGFMGPVVLKDGIARQRHVTVHLIAAGHSQPAGS